MIKLTGTTLPENLKKSGRAYQREVRWKDEQECSDEIRFVLEKAIEYDQSMVASIMQEMLGIDGNAQKAEPSRRVVQEEKVSTLQDHGIDVMNQIAGLKQAFREQLRLIS